MYWGKCPTFIRFSFASLVVEKYGPKDYRCGMFRVLALILLVLPACFGERQRKRVEVPPSAVADPVLRAALKRQAEIDAYIERALPDIKPRPLSEFRIIAPLLGEKASRAQNPHVPSQIDDYRTLRFRGLTVYGRVEDEDLIPVTATVTTRDWKLAKGLNIGTELTDVFVHLGPATERKDGVYDYCGESDCIQFVESHGHISEIRLKFYMD